MNTPTSPPVKRSYLPLYISVGIILLLIALYFFNDSFQANIKEAWQVLTSDDRQKISGWVEKFGYWGPFFIVLAMVIQMFAIVINVVALMVVAVLAYGPVWGSLIALTGIFVASTVGYVIGRYFGETFVEKMLGPASVRKLEDRVDRYGIWAVIIIRISPFLSDDAISFVAGVVSMNYLKFMLATAIGVIPLVLLIAFLGEDFERLKSGLVWISVISIGGLILYFIFKRFFKPSKSTK